MSKTTIALRFFELTTDVTNPKPDRRSGRWPCLPTFKQGMRFIERVESGHSRAHDEAWSNTQLFYVNGGQYDRLEFRTFDGPEAGKGATWLALEAAFKEVEPTAEEWLDGFTGFNRIISENLLVELLVQFKVSRRDVEQAYQAYHDRLTV